MHNKRKLCAFFVVNFCRKLFKTCSEEESSKEFLSELGILLVRDMGTSLTEATNRVM